MPDAMIRHNLLNYDPFNTGAAQKLAIDRTVQGSRSVCARVEVTMKMCSKTNKLCCILLDIFFIIL
jgi:hypothetical protein